MKLYDTVTLKLIERPDGKEINIREQDAMIIKIHDDNCVDLMIFNEETRKFEDLDWIYRKKTGSLLCFEESPYQEAYRKVKKKYYKPPGQHIGLRENAGEFIVYVTKLHWRFKDDDKIDVIDGYPVFIKETGEIILA